MAGSKFFSVMVIGDKPDELMAKYDASLKVKPYIKYRYLEAEKMQKNAIKVLKEVVENSKKFGFNKFQSDYFKDKLKNISSLSTFEYYRTITDGLYYDENGNALSEENPNSKWTQYNIGKNFSYPLKLKGGGETYQAFTKDIDWDEMHMSYESVRLFETLWELVVNDDDPSTEQEEQIKKEWSGRKAYFDKFKDKDQFVAHNCAYWNYAYLDKDGWHDVDDEGNELQWVSTFFERFVEKLNDDDKVTIFEYSFLEED